MCGTPDDPVGCPGRRHWSGDRRLPPRHRHGELLNLLKLVARRAHARTYSPPSGPTLIGSAGNGAVAGPFTTAADWRGSKAAPWQGQTSKLLAGSKPTVQPAWVQAAP